MSIPDPPPLQMLRKTALLAACAVFGSAASATLQLGGPLDPPSAPDGNPITAEKAFLGQALFWEEQLSSSRTVACGTCHVPAAGGSDPRAGRGLRASSHPGPDGIFGTGDDVVGAAGVPRADASGRYLADVAFGLRPQVTARLSQPALDAGYGRELFWDGRAGDVLVDPLDGSIVLDSGAALEAQALAPILSPVEMGHAGRTWEDVLERLAESPPLALASEVPTPLADWIAGRDYPALFAEVFDTDSSTAISPARIAMALATYERTLVSDRTPLDDYLAGLPALTDAEERGLDLFLSGRTDCGFCHLGNRLTNDLYHDLGLRPAGEDDGRYTVSGFEADRGRFKTPGLRNVELRPVFMHNGAFATLEEVVDFYDRGGLFDTPNRDVLLRPLGLTDDEKADLVAFLKRPLTDPRAAAELPPFDRPQLYAESDRVPVAFGAPSPGTGGIAPSAVALEPPSLSNPRLTLALADAPQGGFAVLGLDSAAAPEPLQLLGVDVHLAWSAELQLVPVGFAQGPGRGHTSVAFDLTRSPALAGATVVHQWFVLQPGDAGLTLSATSAVVATLF